MGDIDETKHVIIDIPEYLEYEQWSKCLIYRVPRKLRGVKLAAYTPQLISIGPFHYGQEKLKAMESIKQKYHEKFIMRLQKDGGPDPTTKIINTKIEEFIRKQCSEKIRGAYAGTVDLEDDEFVKMILIDACFIIELFLRNIDPPEESRKDYILSTPWLKKAIKLDLILLENQLPLFVLKQLYDHEIVKPRMPFLDQEKSVPGMHPFLKLTCFFFRDHNLTESKCEEFSDIIKIKHFTDLVREFWFPREYTKDEKNIKDDVIDQKYLYSATKLDKAGVNFVPAKKEARLTDVELSKVPFLKIIPGMQLKLPELKLENDTECLLRNVMALEQCLYPTEDYVCSYVALMDQLINTGEDVDFLVEKKIITNLLGSNKEAAKLFNGLCDQIPMEKCRYARYFNDLNKFYENRWNVYKATLKRVYFKDLWTGSSTVVGLFVLLFTISATLRNVYFRHL